MFTHLKTKLAAEWHRLVTGSEHDTRHVLEWLLTELEGEFMTVEAKLDQIIATLATVVTPTPVDISGLATATAVADVSAKLDALATVVGTETPVTPPAA